MVKHHRSAREEPTGSTGLRGQRLEELFREELNSLLDGEVNDPRLEGTRVTLVELSRDGSRARIWFATTINANAVRETRAALERASGFLRSRLCEALPLKRIPELRFRHDPTAAGIR
ncbi:MAG TPA: 30S ribosome-binding factor RbfA [Polyangiaceae bacterium]|jgi:ribosome-binding factor A